MDSRFAAETLAREVMISGEVLLSCSAMASSEISYWSVEFMKSMRRMAKFWAWPRE